MKSAGIFQGNYPLNEVQEKAAKELGVNIKGRPKPISINLLKWQDMIIVITDDFPKGLFNYGPYKNKVIEWKIKDTKNGKSLKQNKIVITSVMKKIEQLNKELNKK